VNSEDIAAVLIVALLLCFIGFSAWMESNQPGVTITYTP
jgi:hypothetical protein